MQSQQLPKNIDILNEFVKKAFQEVASTMTNIAFLSSKMVMKSLLEYRSKNNFKLAHTSKKTTFGRLATCKHLLQ